MATTLKHQNDVENKVWKKKKKRLLEKKKKKKILLYLAYNTEIYLFIFCKIAKKVLQFVKIHLVW